MSRLEVREIGPGGPSLRANRVGVSNDMFVGEDVSIGIEEDSRPQASHRARCTWFKKIAKEIGVEGSTTKGVAGLDELFRGDVHNRGADFVDDTHRVGTA